MFCPTIGLLEMMLPRTRLWHVVLAVAVALAQARSATAGGGICGSFVPRGTAYSVTKYGSCSANNPQDVWTITFTGPATGTADLTGLTADLDLEFRKSDGTVIQRSQNGGVLPERISFTVAAGTYNFRVYRYGAAQSAYALRLNFTVASPCVTALDFNGGTNPRGFFTQTIGTCPTGTTHWVVFNITYRTTVPIRLSGMSIDLDMDLRKDSKTGPVVASSDHGGTTTENIVTTLDPGLYYLRIYRYGSSGSTSYRNEIQTGGTIRW